MVHAEQMPFGDRSRHVNRPRKKNRSISSVISSSSSFLHLYFQILLRHFSVKLFKNIPSTVFIFSDGRQSEPLTLLKTVHHILSLLSVMNFHMRNKLMTFIPWLTVTHFDISEEELLFWNTLNYLSCEEEAVVSVKENTSSLFSLSSSQSSGHW